MAGNASAPRSLSMYAGGDHIKQAVQEGRHRNVIGGMWDEIGDLQLAFLKSRGLTPQSKLLDIGCGSLRLGVRAVGYLDAGNYWGTDLHEPLLDAGYEKEIGPAGLSDKLDRRQLVSDSDFEFAGVPEDIDMVIATSVFTHLPLNHLRLCLHNLQDRLKGPCQFYFTVFLAPSKDVLCQPVEQFSGGVVTHTHNDPYHYLPEDMHYAAALTRWSIEVIGDWGHPRNQQVVLAKLA